MNREQIFNGLISYSLISIAVGTLLIIAGAIFIFNFELRDVGHLFIIIGILGIVVGFPYICLKIEEIKAKI